MTTARCPACGASVLDAAPWCTLCYTDLRAPAVAPVSAVEAVQAPAVEAFPAPAVDRPAAGRHAAGRHTAPAARTPQGSTVDLLDPLLDAPVSTAADAVRGPATWPCLTCGASVELEHDACPQCGTGFLVGAEPDVAVDVPLVGPIRPLSVSKGSRPWLMIGGGVVVCVVLLGLLSIVGLFL